MFDVMFWRRRRPWWQRLGVGFELKVPSFQVPEVDVARFRMPWMDGRRFEAPQVAAPAFWARRPWERRFEMPRFQTPAVSAPWFRTPAASAPWLRTPDVEMPRFEVPSFGSGWLRRFEAPPPEMPEMPYRPHQRFDFDRWWPYLAAAAFAGGLLVYFLDPQLGRRRRAMARDRLGAQFRHTGRRLARTGRGVGAWGYGMSQRAAHPRFAGGEAVDDVALVDRVRAELFRHDVPREHLSINAARGTVELRGQVDGPDEIGRIESLVRRVPGVYGVHNYLHTPGTPAPNKANALSVH